MSYHTVLQTLEKVLHVRCAACRRLMKSALLFCLPSAAEGMCLTYHTEDRGKSAAIVLNKCCLNFLHSDLIAQLLPTWPGSVRFDVAPEPSALSAALFGTAHPGGSPGDRGGRGGWEAGCRPLAATDWTCREGRERISRWCSRCDTARSEPRWARATAKKMARDARSHTEREGEVVWWWCPDGALVVRRTVDRRGR